MKYCIVGVSNNKNNVNVDIVRKKPKVWHGGCATCAIFLWVFGFVCHQGSPKSNAECARVCFFRYDVAVLGFEMKPTPKCGMVCVLHSHPEPESTPWATTVAHLALVRTPNFY